MNKKISLGVTIALILVAMAVTVSATVMISMRYFSGIVNGVAEQEVMYDFIADVDKAVRDNYAGTIDEEALRQSLARAYADGFGDPYAAYYTAEEYAVESQALQGNYTGFGLEIDANGGQLIVSAVYADSAAEKAGLKKQDVITAVDEERVKAEQLDSVRRRLKNPAKMMLSVVRAGEAHSFTLSPSTIALDHVENRLLGDGVTGYVRIRGLAKNTPAQLRSALSVLAADGAMQYVIDLRDNTGGDLQATLEILDFLLPRGVFARLVTSEKSTPTEYTSTSASQLTERVVVLVNENTEGEAELIAGAMQECGGVNVIGVTTHGRARVQSYFTLKSSNAAVRVSIGTLQLVKGGSWEGVGITPDREVELAGSTPFDLREEQDDTVLQAALVQLNGVGTDAATTAPSSTTAASTTTTASTKN